MRHTVTLVAMVFAFWATAAILWHLGAGYSLPPAYQKVESPTPAILAKEASLLYASYSEFQVSEALTVCGTILLGTTLVMHRAVVKVGSALGFLCGTGFFLMIMVHGLGVPASLGPLDPLLHTPSQVGEWGFGALVASVVSMAGLALSKRERWEARNGNNFTHYLVEAFLWIGCPLILANALRVLVLAPGVMVDHVTLFAYWQFPEGVYVLSNWTTLVYACFGLAYALVTRRSEARQLVSRTRHFHLSFKSRADEAARSETLLTKNTSPTFSEANMFTA